MDLAVASSGDNERLWVATSIFKASIPVVPHTFVEADIPLAFGEDEPALGVARLGARHVFRLGTSAWLELGGGLGLPTLIRNNTGTLEAAPVAKALWDLSRYFESQIPIDVAAQAEGHLGEYVALRGSLGLTVLAPYGSNDEPEALLPHMIEVQIGHKIGGGLRVQGVLMPTFEDLYQLAFQPFFSYEGGPLFTRVSITMPADEGLGPPFSTSWGFGIAAGGRLE